MDDTQQTAQPATDNQQSMQQDSMSSLSDVAGMTPPPPAPVMPSTAGPVQAGEVASEAKDDYSYAEDVLNEILDSLDRIEVKLEAMEKKMG